MTGKLLEGRLKELKTQDLRLKNMNDTKNILLAWISSVSSVWTAIEAKTWITLISAIVLPILFFMIGKSVDVALQIYFRRKQSEGEASNKNYE